MLGDEPLQRCAVDLEVTFHSLAFHLAIARDIAAMRAFPNATAKCDQKPPQYGGIP